jgi:hypothetical protein
VSQRHLFDHSPGNWTESTKTPDSRRRRRCTYTRCSHFLIHPGPRARGPAVAAATRPHTANPTTPTLSGGLIIADCGKREEAGGVEGPGRRWPSPCRTAWSTRPTGNWARPATPSHAGRFPQRPCRARPAPPRRVPSPPWGGWPQGGCHWVGGWVGEGRIQSETCQIRAGDVCTG